MDYPQLRAYIIGQEDKGISRSLIKESLITRGGWREDIVMASFAMIDSLKNATAQATAPLGSQATQLSSSISTTTTVSPTPVSVSPITQTSPLASFSNSPTVSASQPVAGPATISPSSISDTMSPVQAQNKLSMLDTLYAARTGAPQASPLPMNPSTISQPTANIQTGFSAPTAFAGMPTDGERIIVPPQKRNYKKIALIVLALLILSGLLFGAWYAYGYFVKPEPSSVVNRSLPALLSEETIPYQITGQISGVKDIALGTTDGKQNLVMDGVYMPKTKVSYGEISFNNQDNNSYGARVFIDQNTITLGALTTTDTDKKTIEVDKDTGISVKRDDIGTLRTLSEQMYVPESTPSWQALDAFFAIYTKNRDTFSDLASYAKVLPDVVQNGTRMRHLFVGTDEIKAMPEAKRVLLSSVRASVKEIELFTTWYPEKIQKARITIVNKDDTGVWSEFSVTALVTPPVEKFAKPTLFGKVLTLASFVEQKKIQEIQENREAFLQAAFAQVDLYKSSKKTTKGFCLSKTGLADLTVPGSPFTSDNVFCKDSVDGVSVTLPDQVSDGKYVCRDLTNPALVSLETKPLLAVCK